MSRVIDNVTRNKSSGRFPPLCISYSFTEHCPSPSCRVCVCVCVLTVVKIYTNITPLKFQNVSDFDLDIRIKVRTRGVRPCGVLQIQQEFFDKYGNLMLIDMVN